MPLFASETFSGKERFISFGGLQVYSPQMKKKMTASYIDSWPYGSFQIRKLNERFCWTSKWSRGTVTQYCSKAANEVASKRKIKAIFILMFKRDNYSSQRDIVKDINGQMYVSEKT